MSTVVVGQAGERVEKRARALAAMGLVKRVGSKFVVYSPALRGKRASYRVWRDSGSRVLCSCLDFAEGYENDRSYRCEHILAVKYSIRLKNTENIVDGKTESPDETSVSLPTGGEQKNAEVLADTSDKRQSEVEEVGTVRLRDTGGSEMSVIATDKMTEVANGGNNMLTFPGKLKTLRENVGRELVKSREGWRDRNGNVHMVDYIEWHTVADILDENAPDWAHSIRDIRQMGPFFIVVVSLTIDGVTREGLGTGPADSEVGIKKAEHDALKRAAVKFGIARNLYKKADSTTSQGAKVTEATDKPADPVARSLSDLVTAKQLGMIRALAREKGVSSTAECEKVLSCAPDELSRRAASYLINHMQSLEIPGSNEIHSPLVRSA